MGIMREIGMIFDNEETKERKRKEDFENFLENGDEFRVTLPEIIEVPTSAFGRGASAYVFGLTGYAVAEKTKEVNRQIKTHVKAVEKGLYIYNATMEGKDMKIPWDSILKVTIGNTSSNLCLHFVDGRELELFEVISYDKLLFDFLNDRACGEIEDGWDTPIKIE